MKRRNVIFALVFCLVVSCLAACGLNVLQGLNNAESSASSMGTAAAATASAEAADTEESTGAVPAVTTAYTSSNGVLDTSDLFTERDLTQTADLSEAVTLEVSNGEDLIITEEGVYLISGTAEEATIIVEADDAAKVQLVLSDLTLTNSDFPCIYVKEADKVFVTLEGENELSVTGAFTADGSTNTDGVIFSRSDLVLNGTGSLTIASTENGIVGKDDLKVTGGTYVITAASKTIEANDSIRIADGSFVLTAGTDALHAENDDDDTLGYIYIGGGEFTIDAGDDGIHGTSIVQIDDGSLTIRAAEGIEGTVIQLNGGSTAIEAGDDGINAAQKSDAYRASLEITGGELTVDMGQGDTDAVDSNGDLTISGGTISITAQSPFDFDGSLSWTGGTVIVNGREVTSISSQMAGGGMGGSGFGGGFGGSR